MGGQGHPSRHKPAPLCVPHHSLTDTFSSLRARLLLILHLQTFLRILPQPRALARRACCPLSTNLHPPWDDGCPGCPHAQAPGGTPQVLLASLYLCSQHCTEGQQVSATTQARVHSFRKLIHQTATGPQLHLRLAPGTLPWPARQWGCVMGHARTASQGNVDVCADTACPRQPKAPVTPRIHDEAQWVTVHSRR